jgi:hypothetical protein
MTTVNNSNDLIKAGLVKASGLDYITTDGRKIVRTYVGRRQNTLRWKIEGSDFCYRNIFEAYYDLQYK